MAGLVLPATLAFTSASSLINCKLIMTWPYGRYAKRPTGKRSQGECSYEARVGVYRPRIPRNRYRTVSSIVRLTQEASWAMGTRENSTVPFKWNAFQFSAGTMPGFRDYQGAYTHFRLLYARLTISTFDPATSDSNETLNYLIAGSRPFAASNAPVNESSTANSYVPPQHEQDLRQTKWQKVHYPSKVSNKVVTSFHPYTMVATHGPATQTSSTVVFQRIWEGRTWMPITWTLNSPLIFYGPYVAASTMQGRDPDAGSNNFPAYGNLEVLCQFRGQK